MWKVFEREEFSLDRFRSVFPTSQAPKITHDLAKNGYIKRVKRGVYRVTEPEDFIKNLRAALEYLKNTG